MHAVAKEMVEYPISVFVDLPAGSDKTLDPTSYLHDFPCLFSNDASIPVYNVSGTSFVGAEGGGRYLFCNGNYALLLPILYRRKSEPTGSISMKLSSYK